MWCIFLPSHCLVFHPTWYGTVQEMVLYCVRKKTNYLVIIELAVMLYDCAPLYILYRYMNSLKNIYMYFCHHYRCVVEVTPSIMTIVLSIVWQP